MKKLILKKQRPKARSLLLSVLLYVFAASSILANANNELSDIEELQSTITGTINDENGSPLPGASIIVKGTTNGTQTDFDGNYTIDAPSDGTLIISYIGYQTQEVAINGQSRVDLNLAVDASQLDEVVVVGYGTQQKKDVTGSLSQVEGKALTIAPPPNLSAALSGQLSGVIAIQSSGQPGFDDAAFQIRGRSTTGNNSPLVLVDGVERPFNRVNPFEVASVTALKDAASTAVYGSRAANGVLLVTTNRGKVGKPSINFSTTIGFQSPAGRPELMSASEYVLAFRQAFRNDGTAEADLPLTDLVSSAEAGTVESFDWWGATLGNSAPQEQYNFSVNGGNDKLRYFFSYGLLDQKAFFDNAGFRQSSIRSNVDANITKGLTFSLNLAGRLENTLRSSDGDGEIFSNALRANPLLPIFVNDRPGGENLPANSLGFDGFSGNSVGDANRNGSRTIDRDYFQSNFQLEYEIPGIEGLKAKAMYSYDRLYSKDKSFFTPYVSYQTNEATGELIPNDSDNLRSLTESRTDDTQQTTQLSLSYRNEWGDHYVSALALFEQIETKFDLLSGFRDGFISPAIQEFFAGGVLNDENFGTASETARRGYVGRIDYGYKNKYLLQANLRLDQSYIFPENSRNGYFPAFSAGWRVSEEPFLADNEVLTNLKLRGSWGITGNDRVNPFQFLSGFAFGGGFVQDGNFQQGIGPTVIGNPNITWETATTTDIGLEAGFLDGKFGLEVDYYTKRTEDILAPRSASVPLTFGAQLPDENLGVVDSWGWEFTARHKNTLGDFFYNVDANLTIARNEIVFIDEAEDANPATSQEGNEIGAVFGLLSDGLFQSQAEIDTAPAQFGALAPGDIRYKDINGRDGDGNLTGQPDGVINQDDRTLVGSSDTPAIIYGLNLNAGYKGLNLSLSFQGATDYSLRIQPVGFLLDVGNNFDVLNDSWTADNPGARYPRILSDGNANNNQASDFWQEELNFVRLRRAQLSYDFANVLGILETIGVKTLSVSASGTNLLTFSNISLGDPEGRDGNALFYPISRTISFGVQVGF